MDPQYVAPTGVQPPPPTIQWGQHADGTWGWIDTAGGRTWDPVGNPYRVGPAAAPAQPGQLVPPVQPQQAQLAPAVQAQHAIADPLVNWFKTHSGTNVQAYNFNKLKGSTQQLTLAAAEAAGHDKADVYEDIQRTLPRAVGPRRGYVAPLGAR